MILASQLGFSVGFGGLCHGQAHPQPRGQRGGQCGGDLQPGQLLDEAVVFVVPKLGEFLRALLVELEVGWFGESLV